MRTSRPSAGKRGNGPWRWIRWLAIRLLALAALVTVAVAGYHWAEGASFPSAVRMTVDDYRLLAACPKEAERIRDFVRRAPPADGDYASMAARHGAGWEERACRGEIAFASVQGRETAPAPVPATRGTATPSATEPDGDAATAQSTPAPTATGTAATPAPTPTGTASGNGTAGIPCEGDCPHERHIELKRFMLKLINEARESVGVSPVTLGVNAAAQLHAESMLAGCFASHWGLDGLKPSMRYSLAGGYQSNGENVSGLDYCITAADGYRVLGSADEEVREAVAGWMASPGHRDNILNPSHKRVNIGLAWDSWNFQAVQHFEGGYAEYERLPAIADGHLILAGKVMNGPVFAERRDLRVQVYFDPPPHALTRGQLARTYCYGSGLPVAALRPRPGVLSYYAESEFTTSHAPCPNPYHVPADARAPRSPDEAGALWQAAYDASQSREDHTVSVPWITVREWKAEGDAFSVRADLSDVLARHGPGVYSLVVWGSLDGEPIVISEYSIFHEVDPPEGYLQHRSR